MDLKDALKTRRSVRRFRQEPVPDAVIEEMLAYAPWVPNHHVSEPWRFVVVTGPSLQELAEIRKSAVLEKRAGEPNADARAEKARDEFLESAAVIVVIQRLDPNPVRREEDYAAVTMAAYNLMLVGWELGVGSFWNTGPLVASTEARTWLGLLEDEKAVAFLRIGYPEMIPVQRRSPIEERTVWRR
ncbi:MAG: nitroreductase [Firmicutes bacterium]|nr:nitroreductase [Bacillota bacterium]